MNNKELASLLWRIFVPGDRFGICVWIIALALSSLRDDPHFPVIQLVMIALNLWSYDYQRRHGV